jgi:hypothetical protein
MKTRWGALALVLTLVVGQRVEAAGEGVEIVLQPQPGIHAMRLHLEQGAAPDHACTGPCVLRVSPGPYQLAVIDDHGESKARSLDLVSNESIAVAPPRHRLATAGAVMAVTGLVVAGVSGAIFGYGVIEDFRAWSCDSCGTVSRETVVISATVFTAGVVVGVAGALVALAASRPTVTERPD